MTSFLNVDVDSLINISDRSWRFKHKLHLDEIIKRREELITEENDRNALIKRELLLNSKLTISVGRLSAWFELENNSCRYIPLIEWFIEEFGKDAVLPFPIVFNRLFEQKNYADHNMLCFVLSNIIFKEYKEEYLKKFLKMVTYLNSYNRYSDHCFIIKAEDSVLYTYELSAPGIYFILDDRNTVIYDQKTMYIFNAGKKNEIYDFESLFYSKRKSYSFF